MGVEMFWTRGQEDTYSEYNREKDEILNFDKEFYKLSCVRTKGSIMRVRETLQTPSWSDEALVHYLSRSQIDSG